MQNQRKIRGSFEKQFIENSLSYKLFLKDINKLPVLNNKEQMELAIKAQKGDIISRNKLIECNYKLLIRISKQFMSPYVEINDLINEGFFGLNDAINKFDANKNVDFCNYAGWWIRLRIYRYIKNYAFIKIPEAKFKHFKELDRKFSMLQNELQRTPTFDELCDSVELNEKVIETFFNYRTISFFDYENECDFLHSKSEIENIDNKISANTLLSTLDEKSAKLLKEYFGIENNKLSFSDLTKKYNLSSDELEEKVKSLIKKIKHSITHYTNNLTNTNFMRFVKSSARALRIEVLPIHFRWARKMMLYMIGLLGQIKHELTISPEKDLITERLMKLFPVFIGKSKAPGNLLELATKDPHVLELLNDNSSESSWSLFGCSSYSKRFFGGEEEKVSEGESFYESLNYIEQQKKACDMFYESLLSYPDNFLPYRPNDGSVIVTNLSPNIRIPAFCTVYVETSTYLLGLISRISRLTILEGIPQCINADVYKENAQLDFVIPSNGLKKAYDIKENETFTRDDIEPDKIMTALLNGKRTAESLYSITSCVSAETSWVNSISNVPTGIRLQYLNGMAATRALIGGFSTDWADFFCTVAEPVKHDTGSLVDDARLDSEYEPSYPELCDLVLCIKKAIKELEPELSSPSPYAPIILNGSQSDFDSTWNNEALEAELDSESCTEASERDPDAPNEETKSNSALDLDIN